MVSKIQESYISLMSNKVKQFGGINLAQGLPGFNPPKELLESLKSIIDKPIHQYPPATGNFKIIEHLNIEYRGKIDLDNFSPLVTCGATEAISLIFTYLHLKLKSDYCVLAFNPAYESYSRLPEQFNVPFISFGSLEDQSIDFEKLTQVIQTKNVKILFVSSPGNPHGRVFSKFEMDTLIDLSKELNFYLIFDAVYKDLYFENPTYFSYAKFNNKTFFVNSFSKLYSITGWRIGYLFAHKSHFLKIKNLHDYTGLCAPSILQEAIAQYLEIPNASQKYMEELRTLISDGYSFLHAELTKLGFEIPQISGGYFIWAKLPPNFSNGVEFAMNLYEQERVAVVPGIHFSEDAKDWIRINIARPHNELFEAAKKIEQFNIKNMII